MASDPVKIVMLIILAALEIPAAICLVVWWKRAKRDSGNHNPNCDDDMRGNEDGKE